MPRPATAAPPAATFLTVSSGLGESKNEQKKQNKKSGGGHPVGDTREKAEARRGLANRGEKIWKHWWRASFGSLASILAGLPPTAHSGNFGTGKNGEVGRRTVSVHIRRVCSRCIQRGGGGRGRAERPFHRHRDGSKCSRGEGFVTKKSKNHGCLRRLAWGLCPMNVYQLSCQETKQQLAPNSKEGSSS